MQLSQGTIHQNQAPPAAGRRNNSVRTPWTGERVDFLIALWADGLGATYPQIASRLSELPGNKITRSAVAGKILRLKLPNKDPVLRQIQRTATLRARRGESKPARKQDRRIIAAKKSQPMPVFTDNVIPLRIPFAEIVHHQCHYVVGPVADLVYCGHERAAGSLWCEAHRERCTQRPRR